MILHLPVGLKVFVGSLIVMSMLILAWYIPIAVGQRFTAPMLPNQCCCLRCRIESRDLKTQTKFHRVWCV